MWLASLLHASFIALSLGWTKGKGMRPVEKLVQFSSTVLFWGAGHVWRKNVRGLLKSVVTKWLTWLIPWMQNQATSFDFYQDQWESLLEGYMDNIAQVHK